MFTIKLIGQVCEPDEPRINADVQTVMSAQEYRIERFQDYSFITLDGVADVVYPVGGVRGGYDVCFIENMAGKTIDRIGHHIPEDKTAVGNT